MDLTQFLIFMASIGTAFVGVHKYAMKEIRSDMKEFRDDMTSLPLEKFEEKYSGCFNGMLENVVGSILEHERLLQIVKKEDPLLENDASVSAARNNMHYYKNQVRDLSDEAESKASDSLTRKNFLRK